jgi:hypothetical protein
MLLIEQLTRGLKVSRGCAPLFNLLPLLDVHTHRMVVVAH